MGRTKAAKSPELLDLAELEAVHEDHNVRRAQLSAERKRLLDAQERGEPVHRELRSVDRAIDDLEASVEGYLPALQDARTRQAAAIRRAAEIDRLEREIEVLEAVIGFQRHLEEGVEKYLADHITPRGTLSGGRLPLSRYAGLVRQVLPGGPLHLNGERMNAAGQVAVHLDRARRELEELRSAEEVPA